jgi:hypothetical protein
VDPLIYDMQERISRQLPDGPMIVEKRSISWKQREQREKTAATLKS